MPTIKDRVVQTALKILLEPIFEADFHPNSFAYRPKKNAQQAISEIKESLLKGQTEVVDADLSKYFDTIPHGELLKQVKRRVSDGSILNLIKAWLRASIVEEDSGSNKKRNLPNKRGTPQGGVISPLLANLYLNNLDHLVNEKCEQKPKMVRYADDLVILCQRGQGLWMKERLKKYLEAIGLELNEAKTRVINCGKEGFTFVGFRINWRRSRKSGKHYPHAEPSRQSQQELRNKVRKVLNHWTEYRQIEEVIKEVNRRVQGWSAYFHYSNSIGVFTGMQDWIDTRLSRWLCRKHKCEKELWTRYSKATLVNEYEVYQLPLWLKF